MEELFKEVSKFARENRQALESAEQWLNGNEFDGDLEDAWNIVRNEPRYKWQEVIFIAWLATDENIKECKFEIDGFDPYQWCVGQGQELPQQKELFSIIFPINNAGKKQPNVGVIRCALEEGRKAHDLVDLRHVVVNFQISRTQLKRDIEDKKLISCRKKKRGKHVVSLKQVESLYLRNIRKKK